MKEIQDNFFKVVVLNKSEQPNLLCYQSMHQCVSHKPVYDSYLPEDKAGQVLVKRLLEGNRGEWGCLEHGSISFNVCYYPHDVMVQARTHRIGVTFDCQSMRYTGEYLKSVTLDNIEEFFYFTPANTVLRDRQGKSVVYTQEMREKDIQIALDCVQHYAYCLDNGVPEETARRLLPSGYRQHFVVSFNPRSLLHFTDLRGKANAQSEIRDLTMKMYEHFTNWMPEVAEWYTKHRLGKALLAP